MTPEDLERLVAAGDSERLAEATLGLTEAQRRRLSSKARELHRTTRRSWDLSPDEWDVLPEGPLAERLLVVHRDPDLAPWREMDAADTAVLAMCPFSRAREVSEPWWGHLDRPSPFAMVLLDRRPDWLDRWVDHHLDSLRHSVSWETLRRLIRAGACRKPASEGYASLMVDAMASRLNDEAEDPKSLSERLEAEPELLDDIWRIFEADTPAFDHITDPSRPKRHQETWAEALIALSRRGVVDRGRLLDAAIAGLSTGLHPQTIAGFGRFHDALRPTTEEIAVRQGPILDLLGLRSGQAAGFALRQARALEKAGTLDAERFLASAGGVFELGTKSQPKGVLAIARRLVRRDPGLTTRAAPLALRALAHEDADVQASAIGALEDWREGLDGASEIGGRLAELPATLRARAESLVRSLGGEIDEQHDEAVSVGPLRSQIESIPDRWRRLAGADDAIEACERGRIAEPLSFDVMDVPVLAYAEPVEPIETTDELLDAVAGFIEQRDTAIEVERIIDGIARLCDRRTEDIERRGRPLIKRTADVESAIEQLHAQRYERVHPDPVWALFRLIACWIDPETVPDDLEPAQEDRPLVCFELRVLELCGRVRLGAAGPHLAMPTHRGGWIDGRVLVERLLEMRRAGRDPGRHDLIQALLRVAPDARDEAHDEARSLTGPHGRAVRWALGGDEGPEQGDDAALWTAAGRCRTPGDRLGELIDAGLGIDAHDGAIPASYDWSPRVWFMWLGYTDSGEKLHEARPRLHVVVGPAPAPDAPRAGSFPTVAMHLRLHSGSGREIFARWHVEWLAMVWPLIADPFIVRGVKKLVSRMNMPASAWSPTHAYLDPLFDPDRPWTELTCLLVCTGLVSKDADARVSAIELLIEGIDDGRAPPSPMGEVLARLTEPGWLRLRRLAESLGQAAQAGPLHALFVAASLDRLIGAYEQLPRDLHHVLALQLELLTQLGLPLSEGASARLAGVKGSGKAASLARALTAHRPDAPAPAYDAAMARLAEVRVERAERWAGASDGG
jgi:hypothetical protein